MYVKNIYTILHDFRRPVESATIKIEITIGNDQNLKLHQTRQADVVLLHIVLGRARSGQIGEGWEDRSWEEMEMWEGIGPQVSKAQPPPQHPANSPPSTSYLITRG